MRGCGRRQSIRFGSLFRLSAHSEVIHLGGELDTYRSTSAIAKSYSESLPNGPLPPLWPNRSAYGVAGRHFGSGP
jgi:hypothetical protein